MIITAIEQAEAVNWWRANVQRAGGDRKAIVAESATMLTVAQAEKILGYRKQDISRWAKSLASRKEYRAAICAAGAR
jgi:hypothetical protein